MKTDQMINDKVIAFLRNKTLYVVGNKWPTILLSAWYITCPKSFMCFVILTSHYKHAR